jgi:hypothetical protein
LGFIRVEFWCHELLYASALAFVVYFATCKRNSVSEYTHFTVAFLGAELDRNCGRKIRGNKKNLFCVVVAKLSERRGNMDLPMVQERAGWALWAGEWQVLSGMVEGLNRQDGRRGNWG